MDGDEPGKTAEANGPILAGWAAETIPEFGPAEIKAIRMRLDKSQSEFAQMLGVSVGTLKNWEQGRRKPEGPARALLQMSLTHTASLRNLRRMSWLQPILAALYQQLRELYGSRLVKLVLYGSQARGDAEPGSDIDVLVVLRGPVRPAEEIKRTSDVRLKLSLINNTVISCVYLSLERYLIEQSPFLLNVHREGIPIYDAGTS